MPLFEGRLKYIILLDICFYLGASVGAPIEVLGEASSVPFLVRVTIAIFCGVVLNII